jgi:hypothetical protein
MRWLYCFYFSATYKCSWLKAQAVAKIVVGKEAMHLRQFLKTLTSFYAQIKAPQWYAIQVNDTSSLSINSTMMPWKYEAGIKIFKMMQSKNLKSVFRN